MDELGLYFWGYQDSFRKSFYEIAKNTFDSINYKLEPKVFIVKVKINQTSCEESCVAIEPENEEFTPVMFNKVYTALDEIEKLKSDMSDHIKYEVDSKNEMELKLDVIRKEVLYVLEAHSKNRITKFFCSNAVMVQDFVICTVLQLVKSVYNTYNTLESDLIKDKEYLSVSFLDAVILEYLEECNKSIMKSYNQKQKQVIEREHDEIIRSAGKRLMRTPAWIVGKLAGVYDLFYTFNFISSLKYEGIESTGKIILAETGHSNIEIILDLCKPIEMHNYKAVRKLLEIANSEDICLLSDASFVYGLGRIISNDRKSQSDLFVINFTKYYHWDFLYNNDLMMRVSHGQPNMPKIKIEKKEFESVINNCFKDLHSKFVDRLWVLVVEATRQSNGTIVVISDGAISEADRLENQAIKIEPIPISVELIRTVTSIDGAVLIDEKSNCYAIGVILDGMVSEGGDPSRGARFNSAIRYIKTTNYNCIAVVVSEDGDIDIVKK